jgi:hypothetical protein
MPKRALARARMDAQLVPEVPRRHFVPFFLFFIDVVVHKHDGFAVIYVVDVVLALTVQLYHAVLADEPVHRLFDIFEILPFAGFIVNLLDTLEDDAVVVRPFVVQHFMPFHQRISRPYGPRLCRHFI